VHIGAACAITRSIAKPGRYSGCFRSTRMRVGEERRDAAATARTARPLARAGEEDFMTMDIHQILKKLPHRYPILLVDRVLELEPGKRMRR
jgi:hypothetical protein